MIYDVAYGLVLAGGIIPAGWFAATYRPSRFFTIRQIDASAWVPIILAMYLAQGFRWAGRLHAGEPPPGGWVWMVTSIGLGVMIDLVLILRVVHWQRIRRRHQARVTDAS